MPSVGGSIESVSLDGSEYSVAADNDVNRKLGGPENEVQQNGDGTARLIKSQVSWSLSGLQLSIDDSNGDQERLTELKARNDYFPVAITYASGEVYAGVGQITGELQVSSQSQLASFDLAGPQTLKKQ